MVDCPADGCNYVNDRSGILGHYSGKRDEAHAGGYAEAKRQLEEQEDGGSTETVETDDSTDTTDASGGGDNPTMGNATPDSGSDGGGDTEHELPCGHDSFMESEAPEVPFVVSCDECPKSFEVTEL